MSKVSVESESIELAPGVAIGMPPSLVSAEGSVDPRVAAPRPELESPAARSHARGWARMGLVGFKQDYSASRRVVGPHANSRQVWRCTREAVLRLTHHCETALHWGFGPSAELLPLLQGVRKGARA